MTDLLLLLTPLLLIGIGFYYRRKRKQIERKKEQARREAKPDLVPCFTCGMKIPREEALEKKGRYFCGVKKSERQGTAHNGSTESS